MYNGYTSTQQLDQLLQSVAVSWNDAPKPIQSARALLDQTNQALFEAQLLAEELELKRLDEERQWEELGREVARNPEAVLPSRDAQDLARFKSDNAKADLKTAMAKRDSANSALASLLADDDMRNSWVATLVGKLPKRQEALSKKLAELLPLLVEVESTLNLQTFLGDYGKHVMIPNLVGQSTVGGIVKLINAKPWQKPEPMKTELRYANQPDQTPDVFIVRGAGTVEQVTASESEQYFADPSVNVRPATPEEIALWQNLTKHAPAY